MFPAARISDLHTCPKVEPGPVPHVGGPIITGEPKVVIQYMPAARVGDSCICVGPPATIMKGSPTVLVGYKMQARIRDPTSHGGAIVAGCKTVLVGNSGGGAASGGGGGRGKQASGKSAKPVDHGNGPYDNPDDAARHALSNCNHQSIKENKEYGGCIYKGTGGKYYYTGPIIRTHQDPAHAPIPPGTTPVADYHTHGDYSVQDSEGKAIATGDPKQDWFNSDHFSTGEKENNGAKAQRHAGYRGYLGTPSGKFRKYDPATGMEATL